MIAWLAVVAIQAAVLLAGGLLAAIALRRRAAALRHALWAQVVAAALLIPLVAPLLGEHRLDMALPAAWSSTHTPATPLPAGTPALAALPPGWEDEGPGTTITPAVRAALLAALLVLWGVGAALLGARMLRSRLALRRLRRRARPASDRLVLAAAAAAAAAVGCRRRFALLVHEGIGTPASCGVLRPTVLLPAGSAAWPPERLRAVLLHELAHVAGRHALPQLLSELLCVMHWFDPLAWLAARRLLRERERACDDAVLRAGLPARSYATELVAVASELVDRTRPLAGALALGGARELEARLRAVLDPAQPRSSTRRQHARLFAATATLALMVAALAPPGAAGTRRGANTGPREIESSSSGSGEPAVVRAREMAGEAANQAPPTTGVASAAADDAPATDPYADPLTEVVPATALSRALPAVAGPEAESIRRLLAAAQHTKSWEGDLVRERAEWALAQVRGGEVLRPLTAALSADDWRVQAYAAWSLAVTGDRRAAPAIEPLLDHPVWRVRSQAVFSLLWLDAELPPERVAALAGDPAWQVRIGVVEHLERQGGEEAEATLRRLAADPHGGTRLRAADALRALTGASG